MIGIAVTTFNKSGGTRHTVLDYTLSKLKKYESEDHRIIVIDDSAEYPDSAIQNKEIARKYGFKYFLNSQRKGIPRSKNEGFQRLKDCDYQIWLDDDCYPKVPGWTEPLIKAMDVGQNHILFLKNWAHIRYVSTWSDGGVDVAEYKGATACLMTFSKDIYKEVEGFYKSFGKYGTWHHTLSTKIYDNGYNVVKYGSLPDIENYMGSFDITSVPGDFRGTFGSSLSVEERREELEKSRKKGDTESVMP